MDAQELSQAEHSYEPTQEQAERAAELRRFNLLFIYGPIGLIAAIVLGLVAFLLIVAVNPPSDEALLFISGLADVAIVVALLPILIVGAALLSLIAYGYVRARQQGMAPIRQTQRLLWRMDNVVGRLRGRTKEIASIVASPFISANSLVAYVKALINQVLRLLKRS
jgi:heme/copper-type cytochrome/quinol oxidase subunit 4